MYINIDRKICIGAAPCVAIAGDVFQLDEEGKAIVVGPVIDEANVRLAAAACPVQAIFLYDENKKQIFPEIKDGQERPYEETDDQNPPLTA